MNDEFEGIGGGYVIDEHGMRRLVVETEEQPKPEPVEVEKPQRHGRRISDETVHQTTD